MTDDRPMGRAAPYEDPMVNDRVATHELRCGRPGTGVVTRVDGQLVRVMGDGWVRDFAPSDLYLMRPISAAEIAADQAKRGR